MHVVHVEAHTAHMDDKSSRPIGLVATRANSSHYTMLTEHALFGNQKKYRLVTLASQIGTIGKERVHQASMSAHRSLWNTSEEGDVSNTETKTSKT